MNFTKVCCYVVSQDYYFQWQLGLNDRKSLLLQYGNRKFKYTAVYIDKYNNFFCQKDRRRKWYCHVLDAKTK